MSRTLNQPQGDWAEALVKVAYDGQLAAKSEKGYDVITADGTRLQVKARALDHHDVGFQHDFGLSFLGV